MTRDRTFRLASLACLLALRLGGRAGGADDVRPLIVGETFTVASRALAESRTINVYLPPGYKESAEGRFPVLYMPDGGIAEDFLHIAGLVQVSAGNGTMRPHLLVGIENTERRRDLTGPTENENDRKIAPRVGGSAAFRSFLREELIPEVERRYRTTRERAIVGESLAGLFVVETFLLDPALFDHYIAVDPSLWWNDRKLLATAAAKLRDRPMGAKSLYLAISGEKELSEVAQRLADLLGHEAPKGLRWHLEKMPDESHATIFHPAALKAFRAVLGPAAGK